MTKGAFQTSREIFENPIWQDVVKFRIFFFIVGNAVFSDEGVRYGNVVVGRGQYLRSLRNLADDLSYIENKKVRKYPISTISRKISSLVDEGRIKMEDTELGTLFTVVNYDKYQVLDNYKKESGTDLEHSWNTHGTVMEQSWNNNKNVKNVFKENIVEIVAYLNEKVGANYSSKTKKTVDLINGRLNEGRTVEDFKQVIDIKTDEWLGKEQEKYLRPNTLFTPTNFENYLNQANRRRKSKNPQLDLFEPSQEEVNFLDNIYKRRSETSTE
ncbi:hypothetical protein D3C77_201380 [compost metagenome]